MNQRAAMHHAWPSCGGHCCSQLSGQPLPMAGWLHFIPGRTVLLWRSPGQTLLQVPRWPHAHHGDVTAATVGRFRDVHEAHDVIMGSQPGNCSVVGELAR